jgi:hypothetical protein
MPLPKPEKLDEDERQSPRYPLERVAKLEPPGGGRVRYCLVIDMSDGHSIGRARCPGRCQSQPSWILSRSPTCVRWHLPKETRARVRLNVSFGNPAHNCDWHRSLKITGPDLHRGLSRSAETDRGEDVANSGRQPCCRGRAR